MKRFALIAVILTILSCSGRESAEKSLVAKHPGKSEMAKAPSLTSPSPTAILEAKPSPDMAARSFQEEDASSRSLSGKLSHASVTDSPDIAESNEEAAEKDAGLEEDPEEELKLTTLTGYVVDDESKPLSGCRILIEARKSGKIYRKYNTWSSGRGRFTIPGIVLEEKDQGFRLKASKEPYLPRLIDPLRLREENEPITITLESAAKLIGRVLSVDEKPIENAMIRGYPTDYKKGAHIHARTDSLGNYSIGPLNTCNYIFNVEAKGYEPIQTKPIFIELAGSVTTRDFTLEPVKGGTISGYVKNEEGETLEGANVSISAANYLDFADLRFVRKNMTTGSDGYFLFEEIPEGHYSVKVSHGLYSNLTRNGVTPALGEPRPGNYILRGFMGIIGHVKSPEGQPVPEFDVFLCKYNTLRNAQYLGEKDATKGDPSPGDFTCRNLDPGQYRIFVRSPHYAPAATMAVEVKEEPRDVIEIDIPMEEGGKVSGRIVNPEKEGIPEVDIMILCCNQPDFYLAVPRWAAANTQSSGDGSFAAEHIGSGQLKILLTKKGHNNALFDQYHREAGRDLTDLELEMTATGGIVRGLVYNKEQKPVSGESIGIYNYLDNNQIGWRIKETRTDEHGFYEFEDVSPGPYWVLRKGLYSAGREQKAIQIKGGDTLEVNFGVENGGSVYGVISSPSGRAVEGLKVTLSTRGAIGSEVSLTTEADHEGNYRIVSVPGGDYALSVYASVIYEPLVLRFIDVPEGAALEMNLTLPSANLTGTVLDSVKKSPLEGADIVIKPSAGEHAFYVEFRRQPLFDKTDADGVFHFEHLQGGPYDFEIRCKGYAATWLRNQTVPEKGEIRLEPVLMNPEYGEITVHVTDAVTKGPAHDTYVTLRDEAGEHLWVGSTPQSQTDTAGNCIFSDLPEGIYRFGLSRSGYGRILTNPVKVENGDKKRVDTIIDLGSSLAIRVRDQDGNLVSGAVAHLFTREGAPVEWSFVTRKLLPITANNGTVTYYNLVPGSYIIRVVSEGCKPSEKEVLLSRDTFHTVEVPVTRSK